MIKFVNAKINLGLNIIGKREDGYHLLQTIFVPVGLYSATPANPGPFCDILELTQSENPGEISECSVIPDEHNCMEWYDTERGMRYIFSGNLPDCPPEKNLVVKAASLFSDYLSENYQETSIAKDVNLTLRLHKVLPDGAGMGGGSADATFTLLLLNDMLLQKGMTCLDVDRLEELAVKIGADCPVFVKNRVAYAEGIGERLIPMPELSSLLKGKWLAIAKPDLHISTKEAFAGVIPTIPGFELKNILQLPISAWRESIKNDFEESLFPKYPVLKNIKESLYESGAFYASLTGSGAAMYGIFNDKETAQNALDSISSDMVSYKAVVLC